MKQRIKKKVKKMRPHTSKIAITFIAILAILCAVFAGLELSPNHTLTNGTIGISSFGGWVLFLFSVHVITRR